MENQFLELGMVIISEKLLNETCTSINELMKCSFSSFPIYFSVPSIVHLIGKDLVGVSQLPPLLGLGNDTSYPLTFSSVNGLGNLIPPSFALNLSGRSFIFDN